MNYAGVMATVNELNEYPNHEFVKGDIRDAEFVDQLVPGHDVVVHFAAESHVDRSIAGPAPFLETNVVGTGVLLDASYRHEVPRSIHISTDEVYGSVKNGYFGIETLVKSTDSPRARSRPPTARP